jgi:GT2 family glycosyltransferase
MTDTAPQISIIIPTHNRIDLMRRMLAALEAQHPGTPRFEVIAVADGCADQTVAMLTAYRGSFPVTIVERPGLGPAEARNAGAEQARAPLLLFLDDDVLPSEGLVAAHVAALEADPGGVVIGPYPPAPHAADDIFRLRIRAWWSRHFAALATPGHRFAHTDLLTGNLSLPATLWRDLGGLDPQFARAREDLEFGVRLMQRKARLSYAPAALGWHHEHATSTLAGAFRRAREEGRSDARMALKHPHLGHVLAVVRSAERPRRGIARVALFGRRGRLFDLFVSPGVIALHVLSRLGLWRRYDKLFGALHNYAYHRGATEALDGHWWKLHQPSPPPAAATPLVIDLRDGIETAERRLSEARPAAVCVMHGEREIGMLKAVPGAEPWDGRHLRQALAERMAPQMLSILTQAKHPQGIAPATPDAWHLLGTRGFDTLLVEARRQWGNAGL